MEAATSVPLRNTASGLYSKDPQQVRKSGKPFERFAKDRLEYSLSQPMPPSPSNVEKLVYDGTCHLYKPWSMVPARYLAAIEFVGHGPLEYARIMNARPEESGFTERGGDGLLVRKDNGAIIALQDKDHRHLDKANLTTFIDLVRDCRQYNLTLGLRNDDVHGILIYPEESRVSPGTRMTMERRKMDGIYYLSLQGFEPRDINDCDSPIPTGCATVEVPSSGTIASDVHTVGTTDAFGITSVLSCPPLRGPNISSLKAEEERIASAARPKGGQDREFQRIAARRVAAHPGYHLVCGPPGVGKSCTISQAVGLLVTPREHVSLYSGQAPRAAVVALLTAPLLTQARQLYWNMQGVLEANFGHDWQNHVCFLACETANKQEVKKDRGKVLCYVQKDVPTKEDVVRAFANGVRVFVATEDSAHLLLVVAKAAIETREELLVVKDEAHASPLQCSSSTQLLNLVDPCRGDRAILATASPNANVMQFPFVVWPLSGNHAADPMEAIVMRDRRCEYNDRETSEESSSSDTGGAGTWPSTAEVSDTALDITGLKRMLDLSGTALDGYGHTFYMSLEDAIRQGFCSQYTIVIPNVYDISHGDEIPVAIRNVAASHQLGNAAVMTVQAMHADGRRRCVAYADDSITSAKDARKALQEACENVYTPLHGVKCVANVITCEESALEREAIIRDFLEGPVEDEPDKDGFCAPVFRFIIGVRILDQSIDLPPVDIVSYMSPPSTSVSLHSAMRAYQRAGRGLRFKKNGMTIAIYADTDNMWMNAFLGVLSALDSGAMSRVRVRTSDTSKAFEASVACEERKLLDAFHKEYKVRIEKLERPKCDLTEHYPEIIRLGVLFLNDHVDPKTGKNAKMPPKESSKEGVAWYKIVNYENHKRDFAAAAKEFLDVDVLIDKYRNHRKYHNRTEHYPELRRLGILVMNGDTDPETGKVATMPGQHGNMGEIGYVWRKIVQNVHNNDTRNDFQEFVGDEFKVDELIAKYHDGRLLHLNKACVPELLRLALLFMSQKNDPHTGDPAMMPKQEEDPSTIGGAWQRIVNTTRFREEFQEAVGDALDVGGLIKEYKARHRIIRAVNQDQNKELLRLATLFMEDKVDPRTGMRARMPTQSTPSEHAIGSGWFRILGNPDAQRQFQRVVGGLFDVDTLISRYRKSVSKYPSHSVTELARLGELCMKNAIDQETGRVAHMPTHLDVGVPLGANWFRIINAQRSKIRKAFEYEVMDSFDVDALIAKSMEYMRTEQIVELVRLGSLVMNDDVDEMTGKKASMPTLEDSKLLNGGLGIGGAWDDIMKGRRLKEQYSQAVGSLFDVDELISKFQYS